MCMYGLWFGRVRIARVGICGILRLMCGVLRLVYATRAGICGRGCKCLILYCLGKSLCSIRLLLKVKFSLVNGWM